MLMKRLKKILTKNPVTIIVTGFFNISNSYFFLSSESFPNGRLFAKSTNTGAATKIEDMIIQDAKTYADKGDNSMAGENAHIDPPIALQTDHPKLLFF